jgi:protein-S-isoprenylcysteine O-methyltransferase Ste14
MLRRDPELLRKRMLGGEEQSDQKVIMAFAWIICIVFILLPGFDQREGWSDVPLPIKAIAFAMICFSYLVFFWVMRANSFASRVIAVEEGQRVVAQGPYSFVRHRLYVGTLLMYGAAPFALDCYWALIPFVLLVAVIVVRIHGEERLLKSKLAGYEEYTKVVRYRLIPGVW